jgi:ABC-type branched-subunit amino acid transport system substrate-binding protein
MKAEGVRKFDVESDGSPYGASVALQLVSAAQTASLTAMTIPPGTAPAAPAVVYAGLPGPAATHALDAAASAEPHARLFAPSALYDDTFVAGLSAAAQRALTVSAPGIATGKLDAVGRQFVHAFQSRYGHAPAPQAIFGYEAMRALVATLREAGAHAAARATVVTDFRDLKRSASRSALGAYSIDDGDISIARFVFARVSGGRLVPRPAG